MLGVVRLFEVNQSSTQLCEYTATLLQVCVCVRFTASRARSNFLFHFAAHTRSKRLWERSMRRSWGEWVRVRGKEEAPSAPSPWVKRRRRGKITESRNRGAKGRLVHQGAPNLFLAVSYLQRFASSRQSVSDRCRLFRVNGFCPPVFNH